MTWDQTRTPCCLYPMARDPDRPVVSWNADNKVVQCHNCGHVYTPATPAEYEDANAPVPTGFDEIADEDDLDDDDLDDDTEDFENIEDDLVPGEPESYDPDDYDDDDELPTEPPDGYLTEDY